MVWVVVVVVAALDDLGHVSHSLEVVVAAMDPMVVVVAAFDDLGLVPHPLEVVVAAVHQGSLPTLHEAFRGIYLHSAFFLSASGSQYDHRSRSCNKACKNCCWC